jgi:16S rRNA (cytidine1402-2'-O)-methyltransferase
MYHQPGISLYVVATPIGNLKDITIRALEVLESVNVVVSENVRKTRNLLAHYGIKTRVLSYREENARRMIPKVLELLESGTDVAMVAEAGTPGISDPGRQLIAAARKAGVRIIPVPGPSAVVTAVSVSGADHPRFAFEGFLPRRPSKRRQRLRELAGDDRQLVFYEAPHRLVKCLVDMKAVLGDRRCLIGRELTKLHEDIKSGQISELIDLFTRTSPRGEFVIVCEGSGEGERRSVSGSMYEEAMSLIGKGMKKKEAAKTVAARYGLRAKQVYDALARHPKERRDSE